MILWPAVALVIAAGPPGSVCEGSEPAAAECALRQREDVTAAVSTERIRAILDRPEFAGARDRPSDGVARLLRQLKELWESLLARRETASFSEWTRVGVLAVAFALLVGGFLRLARRRRARRTATSGARASEGPLALEDPSIHLANARGAAPTDPREAIRQALLALLSILERRRWARPDRVRTNRELAAELPSRGAPPEISREVDRLVRWYDRTWYSLEPVESPEATRFLEEVTRFEQRVSSGGAT